MNWAQLVRGASFELFVLYLYLRVCASVRECVLRIMDWPSPIASITPRMLLKRLRNRQTEIRDHLEQSCEELKEVDTIDKSNVDCIVEKSDFNYFHYDYSTFNATPNWPSHRNV